MADGAYRGNPQVIIPYRKPTDGAELPGWKADLNKQHRTVRAQVEHALARMKCFKIPARLPPRRPHIDRYRFRRPNLLIGP
ncbi:transposase family protein [Rhizomonospora bruguierae]|uniref:transposase family protein n=1 Tax=Rhizomonospora bruguierae TaxID=1581705 RepID=UPI0035E464AF